MIAYKLFRIKKNGAITPLFINRTQELPLRTWIDAEDHPTKGYAHRPGWHCAPEPVAPHLSTKNRVWFQVEIENYEKFQRPEHQGGYWLIAQRIKILQPI